MTFICALNSAINSKNKKERKERVGNNSHNSNIKAELKKNKSIEWGSGIY